MHKDSLSIKAMNLLLEAGLLYKSDLSLYITALSSKANASSLIKRLTNKGYIETRSIVSNVKSNFSEDAIQITKKGRRELSNYVEVKNNYSLRKFHTLDVEILNKRLQENTIKVMFATCGIPAFENEKIPLVEVRATLLGLKTRKFNYDDVKQYIKKGAYYTKDEWYKFVDEVCVGVSDTFIGSRYKGIFISDTNCYVVYMPDRGDNKIIKVNSDRERNLFDGIQVINNFTCVYRDVSILTKYRLSKNDPTKMIPCGAKKNKPYALIVSDGNAEVYSMATGNPSGLIKNIDFSDISKKKRRAAERKAEEESERQTKELFDKARINVKTKYSHEFLDAYNPLYDHMFVASRNYSGIRSLYYLCNNTFESWAKESVELFKTNPKYFLKADDTFYPYNELVGSRKIPAIYSPVYDVKTLRKLYEKEYTPTIVTYEDMIDTIARATRKSHRFYDADFYMDGKRKVACLYNKDSTYIYSLNGYPKGIWLIKEKIQNKNQIEEDPNIYSKLPKMFGYDNKVTFYNDIARGRIDVDKVVAKIATKTSMKVIKRHKVKRVTIAFEKKVYEQLKKVSKYNNISMQEYLKRLTYDSITNDYKNYNDTLQDMKRKWKEE